MELTIILTLFAAVALTLVIPAVLGMQRIPIPIETREEHLTRRS